MHDSAAGMPVHARRSVTGNAAFLMGSQVLTWGLAFIVTIALPRYLGPDAVGQLRLGGSLWAVTAMLVAFGTPILLAKEFPRDRVRANTWMGATLTLQLVMLAICCVGMAGFVSVVGYEADVVAIVAIIGFAGIFDIWSRSARAALYGLERMDYVAYADVATKVVYVAVVLGVIIAGGGVLVVVTVSAFTSALIAGLMTRYARRLEVSMRPRFARMREVARESRPYVLIDLAIVAYLQVDVVVMSLLVPHVVLGWYATADGLVGSLLFIPTILMTSLFPVLSRLHREDPDKLPELLRRSFNFLLLMAVPIGLGTSVVGTPMALLLFGEEFVGTGAVLTVFGPVLISMYVTILLGRYALAIDRQRFWLVLMLLGIALTVALDLVLVPLTHRLLGNGALGGALAYLVTETLMVAIGIWKLAPEMVSRSTAIRTVKCVVAGAVMFAAAWSLRWQFILVPILVGAVTYVGMLMILRTLNVEEVSMIRAAGGRVRGRLTRGRRRDSDDTGHRPTDSEAHLRSGAAGGDDE